MGDRLTRVSAYAVCVRAGTLLLVHQSAPGPAQGRWTLPGGGVEFGESPIATVHREVAEETALDATVHQLLGVHDNVYAGDDGSLRHGIRLLFRADVRGTVRLAAGEIDDIGWHPVGRLPHSTTGWGLLAASLTLETDQRSATAPLGRVPRWSTSLQRCAPRPRAGPPGTTGWLEHPG